LSQSSSGPHPPTSNATHAATVATAANNHTTVLPFNLLMQPSFSPLSGDF
jgi:hypothetical protein